MLAMFQAHPVLGSLIEKDVAEAEHKGCNVFGPNGEPLVSPHVDADLDRVIGIAGQSGAYVDPADRVDLFFEASAYPRISFQGNEVHIMTAINVALNGAHARRSND